ncbi:MAG: hypothetical protein AABZ15_12930 [Nitrospirota bacterium]
MRSRVFSCALLLLSIAASGAAEAQQGPAPASSPTGTANLSSAAITSGAGSASVSAPTTTVIFYTAITASIARHFEPSYVTFGGGYNTRSGVLGGNDLLYEAQVYVHYTWNDTSLRKKPEQGADLVRIMVPIRLQVRQYASESSPVRTPSYNPGFRMYYTRGSWSDEDRLFYLSAGLHHYSNGQSGPHYNPDGKINTENGSFSTDYAELTLYWDRKSSWTRFNIRKYLIGGIATWEPEQSHYYEKALAEIAWRQDFGSFGLARETMSVQLTAGYKFNRDYISPGVNASLRDNLQWTAEATIPIDLFLPEKHWQDMRFYVRGDLGYDYYNIHYQEKLQRIHAGFVATNF